MLIWLENLAMPMRTRIDVYGKKDTAHAGKCGRGWRYSVSPGGADGKHPI